MRRLKQKKVEGQYEDQLWLLSLPLDGPIWEGKGDFRQIQSPEEFHKKLKDFMIGDSRESPAYQIMPEDAGTDNGFYLPPKVIAQEEVEEAIATSQKAFEAVRKDNPYWDALFGYGHRGQERLNKAMLLGFNALIAVKSLFNLGKKINRGKILQKLDEDLQCTMGQACKQDIDRGVLMNILTRLYIDALSGTSLTKEHIEEIVGIALSRAGIVEDRRILLKRFVALSDFLHLVGDKSDLFVSELRQYFQKDLTELGSVSFTPSS